MPQVSSDDLDRLRLTNHACQLRLAVYQPAAIWKGTVNGAQADGTISIAVIETLAAIRTLNQDYLVWFGSADEQCDYGTARLRAYAANVLDVFPHNAELPNGAFVTIWEVIQPEAKHVKLDALDVISEDGWWAYTDQNDLRHPIARIGPPAIAYRDATTGVAVVKFYAAADAQGLATIASHAWDFIDGTVEGTGLTTSAIQGTSGAPIIVDYATAGWRYVRYTVTDSNGKTHTRYNPVGIFDREEYTEYSPNTPGAEPYKAVELERCEGDVEAHGWRATVRVLTDAPVTAFPDLGVAILFSEDWYGTEKTSIGGLWTFRENIVMVGFIASDSVRQDWAAGAVEFEIEGIGPLMERLPSAGGFLEQTSVALTGWHEFYGKHEQAAHHILTQHTTVTAIADCNIDIDALGYESGCIDLTEGSILEQLDQCVCRPVRARVGSSAQGILYLEPYPQLWPLADRPATAILATTDPDIRDAVGLGDEKHTRESAQIDFAAQKADGDPLFSLAPAYRWGTGQRITEQVDGIRADDQAEANALAGLWEAHVNNEFDNVSINWRGNYRVFDVFPAEPITVTLTAAQNRRGLVWTAETFWHKRVSYEYRPGGVLLASSIVEMDSFGDKGVTGEYPAIDELPDVPTPEPPVIPPDDTPVPPSGGTATPGLGDLLYCGTNKGVAKCINAYSGTPSWSAINTGLVGAAALTINAMNFDPFSFDGTNFVRMWAHTDDGLYLCTGLPNSASWTKKLGTADIPALIGLGTQPFIGLSFAPSPWTANAICVLAGARSATAPGTETWRWFVVYSLDNGTTWNCDTSYWWQQVRTASWGPGERDFKIIPSQHIANKWYVTGGQSWPGMWSFRDWVGSSNFNLWESSIFPAFQRSNQYLPMPGGGTYKTCAYWLTFPYANASGVVYANDDRAYYTGAYYSTDDNCVQLDTDFNHGWTTQTDKGDASMDDGADYSQLVTAISMWDEDYQAAWKTTYVGADLGTQALWLTSNGGGDGNWTAHPYADFPLSAGTGGISNLFMVPADPDVIYLACYDVANSPSQSINVFKTTNFGTAFTSIARLGLADGIDTVLGGGVGGPTSSILVDYMKAP